jgi:hypothetical protein
MGKSTKGPVGLGCGAGAGAGEFVLEGGVELGPLPLIAASLVAHFAKFAAPRAGSSAIQ